MTEYERGYTDGYKDGLHKYMPEVPSVSIPSLDAKSAKPEPGDVVAVCEACGQHLGLNEIDPYGNGYCHAIPNGDPTTGEMWPEPCGPVYLWLAADVRRNIEEARP